MPSIWIAIHVVGGENVKEHASGAKDEAAKPANKTLKSGFVVRLHVTYRIYKKVCGRGKCWKPQTLTRQFRMQRVQRTDCGIG